MTDDELYWVMDDTNNLPFDMLPKIDPELEAKLMREIDAIHEEIWGPSGNARPLRERTKAIA